MSYKLPNLQIVSSQEAISRKCRLDPRQYQAETELIVRMCKTYHIHLSNLKDTGFVEEVYLPNRFSRVYTNENGVPMIGTSSMLNMRLPQDMRIYLNNIRHASELYVCDGDILISRSGTVGTCTLCGKSYEGHVASDDCIRLRINKNYKGYVAAYIMSKYGHSMLAKDAHGKVIRHLKPDDLENLKIMIFSDKDIKKINDAMLTATKLYDESRTVLNFVDALLSDNLNYLLPKQIPHNGYNIVPFNSLKFGRLDPHMYDLYSNYLMQEIMRSNYKFLGDITSVWTVPRFKRHYLDSDNPNATPLFSSSDIIRANLSASKHISNKLNAKNLNKCKIEKDYILIPCSGAYGGILGKGVLAGDILSGQAVSQHVLRIKRLTTDLNYYYVAAFLCSYKFGYPLITATRFGKDIPEIDPEALRHTPIPIIDNDVQAEIGRLFVLARDLQEKANHLENAATKKFELLFEKTSQSFGDNQL